MDGSTHLELEAERELQRVEAASKGRVKERDVTQALTLIRGDTVTPEAVTWIWQDWLAEGKLHLIGGAPGTGKTTIALALAATITSGGQWPDGSTAPVGSVVIWSGEDDLADTLVPRMRAAGANMARVHFVGAVQESTGTHPFDPAFDMGHLQAALAGIPDVRLVVIDPVVSAISGDSHKNAEVRRGLQPLVELAGELRCALLGVTHFSKGTSGRDPVERITGSLAFGALPRVVLVTVKQEADDMQPERRILMRAKSNLGPDGGGFAYELRQEPLAESPDISASTVVWRAAVSGSARELLAQAEYVDGSGARSATDEAEDWLREVLSAGPLAANEIRKQARQAGISEKPLRSARQRLGIKPQRHGFGQGGNWQWALPKAP